MQILLIGSGTVASQVQLKCSEHGFPVAAVLSAANPQMLEFFDYQAPIVIAPEASVTTETLRKAAGLGKLLFLIAGESDAMAAWASGAGIPAFAYPPAAVDLDRLMNALGRSDSGGRSADHQFRRAVLGSETISRLLNGMAVRKIAVTSTSAPSRAAAA